MQRIAPRDPARPAGRTAAGMIPRPRSGLVLAAGLSALALGYSLGRSAAWHVARREQRRRGRIGRVESRWVRVGDLRIHARVSAEPVPAGRTPVVLVHGLGMSSLYMLPLAEWLAPDFSVLAPDLPGFGRSDKPRHVLTIRELADALAAWMDAIGLKRASFVGNSLGNEILVEFALRHPERIERLVLQGPTPDPDARTAARQIARFIVTGLWERPPIGWIALFDYSRCGPRRYVRTFRAMLRDPIEQKLPRVTARTLVVRGTRDRIVPQRWAERAAALLPDGRLVLVPGAAHAINFSCPRRFRNVLRAFLLGRPSGV